MVDNAARAGGGDETANRPGQVPSARSVSPAKPGERLLIGAMSGTSADGVDTALIAISGTAPAMTCRLLHHHHLAYETSVREAILRMRQTGSTELRQLAKTGRAITLCYARSTRALLDEAGVPAGQVAAIAAHGQTLFHEPPDTIQWLDPALLAAETGCQVISDFRRADCAAGGQGAPLVPFAEYVMFRDPLKTRVLLNIGGIANVTYLPAGARLDQLLAFDTGPGNCISDYLMHLYDPEGPGFDAGGALASRGQPVYPLIHPMLCDPYFAAGAPKSTDGPAMIQIFSKAYEAVGRKFPFENLLKTACMLTATTIADAIRRFDPFPDELIVSGGGLRNEAIMSLLKQPLGDLPIRRSDDFGIPAEAKEAVAFALLGAATLDGVPSNVPSVTGAKLAVVLGSVTPKASAEC